MIARNLSTRSGRPIPPSKSLLLAALSVAALVTVGCSDHRISLQQFLTLQQEMPKAPSPTLPPATQPAAIDLDRYLRPYEVGPGDVLSVTIMAAEQTAPAVPFHVRVNRQGEVDLPGVGPLKVDGLPIEDVEEAIQNAYVPSVYRQAVAHVELTKAEIANVLVTGAVNAPGFVPLTRTQRNLLYAVVGAGGVSSLASGEVTLHRLRAPQEKVTLNILEPEQLQAALALSPLQEGDMVVVQAATPNTIFVGGLVNAPHQQINPPGTPMTVLQAIAASGGLRTDVTPSEATLIRRSPEGKDIHVKLDLDRIAKGRDPNIMLAPGDILWVPDTLLTRTEDWLNRNFFIRGGFSAVVTYNVTGIEFMNRPDLQSGGAGAGTLQDRVDPFGFLSRQQPLQPVGQ